MSRLFVLVAFLGIACAAKNPFLGDWESHLTLAGTNVAVVHRFESDGRYVATFNVLGAVGTLTGTYVHEKDRLILIGKKLTVDDRAAQVPKFLLDQGKAQIEKELMRERSGKVEWKSEKEFVFSPDQSDVPPIVCLRKEAA